jgi:outer membrane protein assembly factor BamB
MNTTEGTPLKRLLVLVTLVFCSPVFAQDAMFRGNPQHTGVYAGPAVPQFTKIRWQFHTNGQVLSSPVVADGTLYVGSSDHNLYALDAVTGALKWKFETAGRITSSPAVSEGSVYFGSFDSNFYAVDAATGKLKWKFKTAGERRFAATHLHGAEPAAETMPDPFDFYLSSPVVSGGAVYFGSGDTNIYALDAATGAKLWNYQTGSGVDSSPTVVNGVVYVGADNGNVYAFSLK